MIQQEDKVFVPFGSDSDRAGQVGIVEKVFDPSEYDPEGVGDTEPLVTVAFQNGEEETFKEGDLRKFSKLSFALGFVRANWRTGLKELGAMILVVSIIGGAILIGSIFRADPPKVEPKPVDPIVRLGQLKADIELKRSQELADQRDLKAKLETSYAKVSGYDATVKEYESQIMGLVNPKDSTIEVKAKASK